jgi:hypothetical protein
LILDLENEIWKDIKGYVGLYQVSNKGRIKSYPRMKGCIYFDEQLLKLHDNGHGYLHVDLYDGLGGRKKYYIHRLVADTFIDNPNNYPQINHKDNDTYNNNYNNLEWCTQKYNNNYGNHNQKISAYRLGKFKGKDNVNSKKIICITTGKIFDCSREAAEFYHIGKSRNAISGCCKGKHKYIGKLEDGTPLVWRYYDEYCENLN